MSDSTICISIMIIGGILLIIGFRKLDTYFRNRPRSRDLDQRFRRWLNRRYNSDDVRKKKKKTGWSIPPTGESEEEYWLRKRDEQRASIKQATEEARTAFENRPIEELVKYVVDGGTFVDPRDAGQEGWYEVRRSFSALDALRKKTDLDKERLLSELLKYMDVNPGTERLHQLFALVGEDALPKLIPYLDMADENPRRNAILALAEIKSGEAVDALLPHIHDGDERVRRAVVKALGYTGHPKAHQALMDYDIVAHPIHPNVLDIARYWANVPKTLAELRQQYKDLDQPVQEDLSKLDPFRAHYFSPRMIVFRRKRLQTTISQLEEQYEKYWSDE